MICGPYKSKRSGKIVLSGHQRWRDYATEIFRIFCHLATIHEGELYAKKQRISTKKYNLARLNLQLAV